MMTGSQYRAAWPIALWFVLTGVPAQARAQIEPRDAESTKRERDERR